MTFGAIRSPEFIYSSLTVTQSTVTVVPYLHILWSIENRQEYTTYQKPEVSVINISQDFQEGAVD